VGPQARLAVVGELAHGTLVLRALMLVQVVLKEELLAALLALVVLVQVSLLVVLSQQAKAGEAAGSPGGHMVEALFHRTMESGVGTTWRGREHFLVALAQVQLIVTEVPKHQIRTLLASVLPHGQQFANFRSIFFAVHFPLKRQSYRLGIYRKVSIYIVWYFLNSPCTVTLPREICIIIT